MFQEALKWNYFSVVIRLKFNLVFTDRFACIKNSTICNEKDTANIESMSAFLPSGYLSPIRKVVSTVIFF